MEVGRGDADSRAFGLAPLARGYADYLSSG
jgi:hypothetical protein